jgi:transcriptional regulator with XRE-family HTH domain
MISKNLMFLLEDVAEKIGGSRQAVAKWENGETNFNFNHIFILFIQQAIYLKCYLTKNHYSHLLQLVHESHIQDNIY